MHPVRSLLPLFCAAAFTGPAHAEPLRVTLIHERDDPARSIISQSKLTCAKAVVDVIWETYPGHEETIRSVAFNGQSYSPGALADLTKVIDTRDKEIAGVSHAGCDADEQGAPVVEVLIAFRHTSGDAYLLTETFWRFSKSGPQYVDRASYSLVQETTQPRE